MALPLHIGLEHPNVVWLVATGVLAFGAGLLVNMYRSRADAPEGDVVEGPGE